MRGRPPRIRAKMPPMCRNIRVLYNFEPPTTRQEIRAAALQYVRKVSGLAKPPSADVAAFETAIDEVAKSTGRLLHSLSARTAVRTREGERVKAHARWEKREKQLRRDQRRTGSDQSQRSKAHSSVGSR